MKTNFRPRDGSEPYIFVSYARKDSKQVAPLLDALHFAGYHVWYDSGIQSGTRWMDSLAKHIIECSVFMPLISSSFADSVNCCDETTYALNKKVVILPVYLKDNVTLPPGLEMRLSGLQSVKLSDYDGNVTRFIQSLEYEELIKPCRREKDPIPIPYDTLPRALVIILWITVFLCGIALVDCCIKGNFLWLSFFSIGFVLILALLFFSSHPDWF